VVGLCFSSVFLPPFCFGSKKINKVEDSAWIFLVFASSIVATIFSFLVSWDSTLARRMETEFGRIGELEIKEQQLINKKTSMITLTDN
jgi:hypothetical protein